MQDIFGLRILDSIGRECVIAANLARARHVTPEAIRQAILTGRLAGTRIGTHMAIPLAAARAWHPVRAGMGTGPRKRTRGRVA